MKRIRRKDCQKDVKSIHKICEGFNTDPTPYIDSYNRRYKPDNRVRYERRRIIMDMGKLNRQ